MKFILLKNLLKYTTHLDYIIFSSFDRNQEEGEDNDDIIIENYLRSMKNKGITWDEIISKTKSSHLSCL